MGVGHFEKESARLGLRDIENKDGPVGLADVAKIQVEPSNILKLCMDDAAVGLSRRPVVLVGEIDEDPESPGANLHAVRFHLIPGYESEGLDEAVVKVVEAVECPTGFLQICDVAFHLSSQRGLHLPGCSGSGITVKCKALVVLCLAALMRDAYLTDLPIELMKITELTHTLFNPCHLLPVL